MGTSKGYNLPTSGNWPDVKRKVTAWAQTEGSATPEQMGNVLSSYVQAHGGSRNAAQQLISASRLGAKLGGLLSGIRSEGLSPTLERLGLGHLIGKPASEVMEGIRDYLTGSDSSLDDEVIIKEAFEDFQQEVIGKYETYDDLNAALIKIADIEVINEMMERLFAFFVFKKFMRDFSENILKKAGGVRQANRRSREIKRYIFDMVRTKLHARNLSQVNWQGQEGIQMAEEIHTSVWRVFGEG